MSPANHLGSTAWVQNKTWQIMIEEISTREATNIGMSKIKIQAEFWEYHRLWKDFRADDAFQIQVLKEIEKNPLWCKNILKIKSRVNAISDSTAETERIFSTMSTNHQKPWKPDACLPTFTKRSNKSQLAPRPSGLEQTTKEIQSRYECRDSPLPEKKIKVLYNFNNSMECIF